jgi:5-methylcytosine-specific restriction enzyme A
MNEIKKALKDFAKSFAKDKQSTNPNYSDFKSYDILTITLPLLLKEEAHLNNQYKCKGSIGNGVIATIPWVSIFDTEITTSSQNGYFIVYLFQEDLKGFYLSLNQGWTQYEKCFKTKVGKEKVTINKNKAQFLLKGTSSFSFENIQLNTNIKLARGYELGNICSKYYSFNSIPDDNELIDDLRNLIGVYRELKGLIGIDIFSLDSIKNEDEFQKEIQEIKNKTEIKDGPIEKPKMSIKGHYNSSYNRDPNISANALILAGNKCENDQSHLTFSPPKSEKQFMEAHHLIPMKFQGEFSYSIDVPENIVCLCPNCHRAFHSANDNKKKELIKVFYDKRKNGLEKRGLIISLDELFNLYGL